MNLWPNKKTKEEPAQQSTEATVPKPPPTQQLKQTIPVRLPEPPTQAPADNVGVQWSSASVDGEPTFELAGPYSGMVKSTVEYIANMLPYIAVSKVYLQQVEGMFGGPLIVLRAEYVQEDIAKHTERTVLLGHIQSLMQLFNISRIEIEPRDDLFERFTPVWSGVLDAI